MVPHFLLAWRNLPARFLPAHETNNLIDKLATEAT